MSHFSLWSASPGQHSGYLAGQAGTGQVGTGQAGTGQAGTGQAGTGQAGTGQARPRSRVHLLTISDRDAADVR